MAVKLWIATVEVEVLIASDDEPSTFDIEDAAKEEIDDNGVSCDYPAEEITALADVPKEWLDTIPRGDSELTCRQIVVARLTEIEEQKWNSPMPNQIALPLEE